MTIHMVTVDRAPSGVNYLGRTLESFTETLPNNKPKLFVGSRETAYLPEDYETVVISKPDAKFLARKPPQFKGSWNYMLAMAGEGDLLLLEDDIIFTTRFEEKLSICLDAIPVDEFILSCWTEHIIRGYPVQQRRHTDYHGTQCVFIPAAIRSKLELFFSVRLGRFQKRDPENTVAHDMLVQQFCEQEQIPIYSSNPSLVNHIGLTSSVVPKEHQGELSVAHRFYHGKPKPYTTQAVESFCTFATHHYAEELRLLAASVALFHPGAPLYVLTDKLTVKALADECPNIVPLIEAEEHHLKRCSEIYLSRAGNQHRGESAHHRPGIFLLKMKAVQHALGLHKNTVFVDSDLLLMAPMEEMPNCDIAMAAHWYDPLRPDMEGRYGTFNAGLVFCASVEFTRWWRETYLQWGFTDQGCLVDAPGLFDTHILSWPNNFGHWRLWSHVVGQNVDFVHSPTKALAEFCGIECNKQGVFIHGQPLRSFHVHLKNDISLLALANVGLRRLVVHCLEKSGRAEHKELLRLYR